MNVSFEILAGKCHLKSLQSLIPGSCGGKAKAEHIRESSLECAVAREGKNMAYTVGPISYRMILDLISFHGLLLVYFLKSCP